MARILVVDDERPVREFIGMLLEETGHQVRLASNGHQALLALEREGCDLVVSDMMMPVMTGAQLVTYLRSKPETHPLPVLLISASVQAGRRIAREVGADDFIPKPFAPDELERAVKALLDARWAQRS